MEFFVSLLNILFLLFGFFCVGLYLFKVMQYHKREEQRSKQLHDECMKVLEVIAGYCFYEGLTKGYEMHKTLEDINVDYEV